MSRRLGALLVGASPAYLLAAGLDVAATQMAKDATHVIEILGAAVDFQCPRRVVRTQTSFGILPFS